MNPLDLGIGDWATWAGAFGTIAAFFTMMYQIHRDRKRWKAEEDYKAQSRERQQAELVSIWTLGSSTIISNQSSLPIYDVIAAKVTLGGQGPNSIEITCAINSDSFPHGHVHVAVVPPGVWETEKDLFIPAGMGSGSKFGNEIAFRDSYGKSWIRKKNGALTKIEENYVHSILNYGGPYPYDSIKAHIS